MPDPWEFGWEALVAFGTIGLAIVTAALAWSTRNLAKETAEEVAAASRPVLIPGNDLRFRLEGGELEVWIENGGGGPALFIRAETGEGKATTTPNLGALSRGNSTVLAFDDATYPPIKRILIDYRDMSGRDYASEISLKLLEEHPEHESSYEFYDVQLYSGRTLTRP